MLIKIHWLKNVREFMLYREEKKTPLCIIYLLYWPPRHLFSLICICPPPPILPRETTPPSVSALGETVDHGALSSCHRVGMWSKTDQRNSHSLEAGDNDTEARWSWLSSEEVPYRQDFPVPATWSLRAALIPLPFQGLVFQTFCAFYKQSHVLLINYFVG